MSETERRDGRAWLSYEQSIRLWWVRVGLAGVMSTFAVVTAPNRTTFFGLVLVTLAILGAFVGGFSYGEWLRCQGKTSWCWGNPASRRR